MPLKVKVNFPEIDISATTKEWDKAMKKAVFASLTTWVIHTVDPIPVWSGAARASFLHLAAEAQTSITIDPVAPSRILLGITEAKSEVFTDPAKGEYGWEWSSTLAHIGIVEDRVGFIDAGIRALKTFEVELPQPVYK